MNKKDKEMLEQETNLKRTMADFHIKYYTLQVTELKSLLNQAETGLNYWKKREKEIQNDK